MIPSPESTNHGDLAAAALRDFRRVLSAFRLSTRSGFSAATLSAELRTVSVLPIVQKRCNDRLAHRLFARSAQWTLEMLKVQDTRRVI